MRITAARKHSALPVYSINGVALPVITQCVDLGVCYDNHLSFTPHVNKIVAKASGRAKLILKCFSTKDASVLARAFCAFVRPVLEFSSAVWCPLTKKDIERIESVQRSFTKLLSGLTHCSYSERLFRLNLDSLQCRRIKADLIMCFKILNGLADTCCINSLVLSAVNTTRGNQRKLFKFGSVDNRDAHFFSKRVVPIWNDLPDSTVLATSVASFKRGLHSFDVTKFCMF
jgi:hypothetical protein